MKTLLPILLVCGIIHFFGACVTPPEYSDVPEIEFLSFSKTEVRQGFTKDTTIITFSFTDGDGDLGSDSIRNIFLIDNRTGNEEQFRIPFIPPQGENNGISGEVEIEFFSTCCILPNQPQPCFPPFTQDRDTVSFDIYIEDQAGNRSNTVTTSNLILLCE